MSLEYGCVLLENVIYVHSWSSADTAQKYNQVGITEGLFLAIGVINFYLSDICITTVLKLEFQYLKLILLVGNL